MKVVSPPPMIDIVPLFPDLAMLAATTVRLHPRRGNPGVRDSSVSGPLLWPAEEPWPWCTAPFEHDGPNAYQPLLQVFARDATTMFFPDGCDLLQLLWCPNEACSPTGDDALAGCPRPLARWRNSADITDVLVSPPKPEVVFDEWFPCNPCVVNPEPVTEYPYLTDLPQELEQRIRAWESTVDLPGLEGCYLNSLSTAPGTKTGGHPRWGALFKPYWPDCMCGRRMTYLLTINADERGAGRSRWSRNGPPRWREDDGHDLVIKGDLLAFVCTHCPAAPLDYLAT